MMKSKGTRALLITVGGGLVVFLLLATFLAGLQRTSTVVVAAQPLPAGALLTADSLEERQVHVSAVLPNALTSVEEAEGQVLSVARIPGDQITADMLGDQATVGLSNQLSPGHRAVAVHVNQASGLLGILRPGDRVTVVAVVDPQEANISTGYYDMMPLQPYATTDIAGEMAATTTPHHHRFFPVSGGLPDRFWPAGAAGTADLPATKKSCPAAMMTRQGVPSVWHAPLLRQRKSQ
jgi:hypothetical protein